MAAQQRLTAKAGDKLDLLLWRDAGLGIADLARVLDANPGLADLGPILPLGTVVIVPASADAGTAQVLPLVQLWSL
ncbi:MULTISPECIES: tail protein X [Sphingomonadaceae]|uniref:Tail protein X n=1 Tax=Novosphingobium clariflavum TaxID=2029884 RepID=A0ABV6S771_9SPHN|nr:MULTISPECIES: tail protein X [Sphingomonadaceae]QDK32573.1 phage tail protein [Sphingomonas sp. IC081]QSR15613.1 phage tail protein [Novosphingobium sp. KA1]QSR17489.1 phage tail protein [Novosphingobium sp. KA1]